MIALINGRLQAEQECAVPLSDRSFLYGDGLYETLRLSHGRPFRWRAHYQRWRQGADYLDLPLPYNAQGWHDDIVRLSEEAHMPEAVLRCTLSRGTGPRGVSLPQTTTPLCVMTLHPVPQPGSPTRPWQLATSPFPRHSRDPLLRFKTCNQLGNILARREAEQQGAHEALWLNEKEQVTEATSANLFWIQDNVVHTPPLSEGLLPGVARQVILELCLSLDVPCRQMAATPDVLPAAQAVFLTVSTRGIIPISHLDGRELRQETNLIQRLHEAYWDQVHALP